MIAFRIAFFTALFVVFLSFSPRTLVAQSEQDCSESLSVAESSFFNGEFDRTIELLQECIDQNAYDAQEGQRVYALLGRTQFVLGESDAAQNAIEQLFFLNPLYEPDPQFPPNFTTFIDDVKQTMLAEGTFPQAEPEISDPLPVDSTVVVADLEPPQPRKKRGNKLLLFGGGAALAAAGVTVAILAGGGNSPDPPPPAGGFPLPPGRP